MVIDTSAIIAILLGEPEAPALTETIAAAKEPIMSAFSILEAGIVIEAKKGAPGGRELDIFLHQAQIRVIPLDAEQLATARQAWRRFGKGRHPAGLNIGDCCAYALAKCIASPLLFKGNDFDKTDIRFVEY